jgi:hypothetical protein
MEAGYAVAADAEYPTAKQKKEKKPGFIDRWLFKRLQNGAAYEQQQKREEVRMNTLVGAGPKLSRDSDRSIDQPERAIHFTVYQANGGRVIETRRYDRHKDRHTNGLYVITSEMDFGKEIDKIITMEHLKS